MRYIIHLYLVLGNCTQVHFQCTVVPKYISQNPVLVLVLVLQHFLCTCTESMYLPQPCLDPVNLMSKVDPPSPLQKLAFDLEQDVLFSSQLGRRLVWKVVGRFVGVSRSGPAKCRNNTYNDVKSKRMDMPEILIEC